MPLYEYRCRSCGHQFEIQQSITEDALTECPECAGSLRKVFAPVGIAFKGSGFYKNDARSSAPSSSKSTVDAGSSSSDSGSGGGSSSSSDSGPGKSAGDTSTGDKPAKGDKSPAKSTSGSGSSD